MVSQGKSQEKSHLRVAFLFLLKPLLGKALKVVGPRGVEPRTNGL